MKSARLIEEMLRHLSIDSEYESRRNLYRTFRIVLQKIYRFDAGIRLYRVGK